MINYIFQDLAVGWSDASNGQNEEGLRGAQYGRDWTDEEGLEGEQYDGDEEIDMMSMVNWSVFRKWNYFYIWNYLEIPDFEVEIF